MEKPLETALLPCAAVAAGLLFFFGALWFWRSGRELRERGVTVRATVDKKLRKGSGLENYYATFSFVDPQGKRQVLELKVHSRVWRMMHEGGLEDITYLPGQPEKSAQGPLWAKRLIGGVALFFAAVGGLMAVTALVLLVRQLAGR